MSQNYAIRNCVFGFSCEMIWDSLTLTDDPKIRFCSECQRQVHFCASQKELNAAISKSLCVAIPAKIVKCLSEPKEPSKLRKRNPEVLVGVLIDPRDPRKRSIEQVYDYGREYWSLLNDWAETRMELSAFAKDALSNAAKFSDRAKDVVHAELLLDLRRRAIAEGYIEPSKIDNSEDEENE
jgi:hypothetical protein